MTPAHRGTRAKRIFDVVAAVVGLVVLAPLLGVIALVIRLDSRGPALFRQLRVGRHGQPFRIHKFRTMVVAHHGQPVSTEDDTRVTRVGRVLRKWKLDELPQLIDVVTGQMSLVGPRPEVHGFVERWSTEDRRIILSVRPGLTCPASIALRNEATELSREQDPARHYVESILPRKVAMYVEYVRERTFLGDLVILVRTVRAVVAG